MLPVLLPLALAADPPAAAPPPVAAAAGPSLPVLLQEAPATYPAAALAEGKEAAVLLEIDVGVAGEVLAARVIEGAGEGFDEAAVQAARGFRFTPARDAQGNVSPARIQYRYRFTVAKAAARSVEGVLRDSVTELPFPGVEVRATGPDGLVVYASTDAEGRFALSGLPDGTWTLVAAPAGHVPEVVPVDVRAGAVAQLVVRARPVEERAAAESVTVQEERSSSTEITERTLSQEEIRYLPGTGGDVVKVVQNLPGVARAPLGVGQLIVRGTAPEDSAFFVDGASIPLVFHFSGLTTILNGDFVAEVAYIPGNYGARYGRALGGLVDLRTKDELPERSRGFVSLDLFQGTAYVEQKVGDDLTVELSVRRSWIDSVLTPVLSSTGTDIRAPRYWDAQARVLKKLKSGGTLDALALYSDDRFAVVGEDEDDVAIGLSTSFGKGRVRWLQPLGHGWDNELVVTGGPERTSFGFDGDAEAAFEQTLGFGVREEMVREPALGAMGWRIGLDLTGGLESFEYDVEAFSPYEAAESWVFAPALYMEPSFRVGPALLTPGVRVDGLVTDFGYARASVDPRLSARIAAGGHTVVKASFGRYGQFPTLRQLSPDADGNPDLSEAHALQASLGVTQQLPHSISVEATAFYNRLNDLVVGREDRFRFFTGPPPVGPFDEDPYGNDGTGRVCGAELLVRYDGPKTIGLLSATFSNSVRVGRDGVADLFEYDQPYVLNALASRELPRRWRVGARVRFGAGDPYTPVVNRVYDMGSRSFLPVYGERDSERLPPVGIVDVRVDKEFPFRTWTLTAYLDLQNALDAQIPEVMSWSYDYGAEEPISGLPIIPAFGLRGEW